MTIRVDESAIENRWFIGPLEKLVQQVEGLNHLNVRPIVRAVTPQ